MQNRQNLRNHQTNPLLKRLFKQRICSEMTYASIYAANRVERASRMVRNIPPHGAPLPPIGLRNNIRFTNNQRYVEYLDRGILPDRNFIVVRSQKYGTKYNWRKTYKVLLHGKLEQVLAESPLRYTLWTCPCRDKAAVCKHILAIVRTYSTYRFRF